MSITAYVSGISNVPKIKEEYILLSRGIYTTRDIKFEGIYTLISGLIREKIKHKKYQDEISAMLKNKIG